MKPGPSSLFHNGQPSRLAVLFSAPTSVLQRGRLYDGTIVTARALLQVPVRLCYTRSRLSGLVERNTAAFVIVSVVVVVVLVAVVVVVVAIVAAAAPQRKWQQQ